MFTLSFEGPCPLIQTPYLGEQNDCSPDELPLWALRQGKQVVRMLAIGFSLKVTIAVSTHRNDNLHAMSGRAFNIKRPLALIDSLDRFGFTQFPTGTV